MLTQNFGAAANFQSFGAVPRERLQSDHACQCGTPTPGYPQPGGYQQPQASGQMQMQMIMSYFMNMMSSMTQLQQGFGSYLGGGQQQPQMPYGLPGGGGGYPVANGGHNGGGGYPVANGGYNGGGGSGYPVGGGYPQQAPAPAPAPPAKKGGYA